MWLSGQFLRGRELTFTDHPLSPKHWTLARSHIIILTEISKKYIYHFYFKERPGDGVSEQFAQDLQLGR